MTKSSLIIASLFLLVAIGLLVWQVTAGLPGSEKTDPLEGLRYEKEAPLVEREKAAVSISRRPRPVAVPQLREIVRNDPDPKVRAAAIAGLGDHRDYRSMDMILDRMEAGEEIERTRAKAAVTRMLGPRVDPQTDDKAAHERITVQAYRALWQSLKGSDWQKRFEEKIDRKYGELP
jgi:hypothetical protein